MAKAQNEKKWVAKSNGTSYVPSLLLCAVSMHSLLLVLRPRYVFYGGVSRVETSILLKQDQHLSNHANCVLLGDTPFWHLWQVNRVMPFAPSTRSTSIEIQIPAPQKKQQEITPNERRKDTQIPPPIIKAEAQWLIELVADFIRAILTDIARTSINQIPRPAPREKVLHILGTRLAGRRGEGVQLRSRTLHWPPV